MSPQGRVLVAATAALVLAALLNLAHECWPLVASAAAWWADLVLGS